MKSLKQHCLVKLLKPQNLTNKYKLLELQSIKQRFEIIGNSSQLNNALQIAQKVAPTDLSVLITGESGVGKEAFSKIIYQLSLRKHEKFIAVNCGAIPEGTIDSELFGHVKGSFTGALDNRKGYFETVNGGTIFLDEIGELPLGTQARLLRVLESGEYLRVGDSEIRKTDVRVIAATNVDLVKKVKQGKFREDLYFRLNTVPIHVPPLRDRGTDIELLFRKFVTDFAERYRTKPIQLTDDARKLLLSYRWPGNVRELKNIAEQASVLIENNEITARQLEHILPKQNLSLVVAEEQTGINERELLYKMLFEMKNDLNNIKTYLWNNGHQEMFEQENIQRPMQQDMYLPLQASNNNDSYAEQQSNFVELNEDDPVVFDSHEEVYDEDSFEESLSISDMEKRLIEKALEKHNGTRKKAALDLGISERTLYRKINEYEIDG